MQPRSDLSKVRHDLRTPINHILGYCEMLLEEEVLPDKIRADLERVHVGGRNLLGLIARYFDDATFGTFRDFQQMQHELRTPVNHIIGYSELLQEQAIEAQLERLVPDLEKIHAGATHWLALMEEHLIPPDGALESGDESEPPLKLVTPGITFETLRPKSAEPLLHWKAHILVVDDDASNRELLARRLTRYGASVSTSGDGLEALQMMRRAPVDLVLLDLLMPGLDGYQVLVKLKRDPKLRHIPVIMVSGLDQENGIARCLEAGAEDYLPKPFNPVFLRARIGACLEKKHWRDQEQATFEALRKSQQHLAAELAEAGAYVRSLLPAPLIDGAVKTRWAFQPSEQLGGDAFGYHWLDSTRFAIYLLDVCGHGVGAALLSVSALNVLRSQALAGTDFGNPAAVLQELNRIFPMEQQNQNYFTLWYGVYDLGTREIAYSSAGHPPALLIHGIGKEPGVQPLRTGAPPIGCLPEAAYKTLVARIPEGASLWVFSDGVYEIELSGGKAQSVADFSEYLRRAAFGALPEPEAVLKEMRSLSGRAVLDDDFSLVVVGF